MLRCSSLLVAMILAFSSCGIFEDREGCPCWLTFFFDNETELSDDVSVYAVNSSGGKGFDAAIDIEGIEEGSELEVMRDTYRCSLFSGIRECIKEGMIMLIPENCQADRLFLYTCDVDCNGEFAEERVEMKKEWTTVKISFENDSKVEESVVTEGISIVISSDVCGVDLLSGEPVIGSYRFIPILEDNSFSFRLLRHSYGTDRLVADIYYDSQLIDSFHLGNALDQINYDWNEPHLSDVFMSFDLEKSEAFIKVVPWTGFDQEHVIF